MNMDISQHQPANYFCLKLNSNYSFYQLTHPTNNCYNFTIEFPQSSSDSMQYQIAQCNRYQITHVLLQVGNLLLISQTNTIQMLLLSSVMKRQITTTYTGQHFKTRNGLMNLIDYKATHEELYSIHIMLNCNSLRETLDTNAYKRNFSKNYPPSQKVHTRMTHKPHCCMTAHYTQPPHHTQWRRMHHTPSK